ncbi:MAG: cyanophycin synthetase, partial [Halomonas venusta]|nr:cyanophycin synthetase [Halomonas venusta]
VPAGNDWGVVEKAGRLTLAHGDEAWLNADDLTMAGRHNYANALAALAMGKALGFAKAPMCQALAAFKGLPHRSEVIARINGVMWVNDSKGTNVGATLAAIQGISASLTGKIILLAGGVGKGADFTPLAMPLAESAKTAVLFGADAHRLEAAISSAVPVHLVSDLTQAMEVARGLAEPGDCVLLSPACASLDQFANYQARGDAFRAWVEQKHKQHNHSGERL